MKKVLLFFPLALVIVLITSACTQNLNQEEDADIPPTPATNEQAMEKKEGDAMKKDEGEAMEKLDEVSLEDGSYEIKPSMSRVEWSGERKLISSKHTGTIDLESGEYNIVNGELDSLNVLLDMTTLKNEDIESEAGKARLEGHLKSEDFFGVETYPKASFVSTEIKKLDSEEANYEITGDLTIKETTESITFPAQIKFSQDGTIGDAVLEFDRTVWDIRFGSGKFFENLGDQIIDDMIALNVRLVSE